MAIGFETGKMPLDLKPERAFVFTSAANPELLPKPEPWAMREHFVMSPIRSREVARAQRSGIRLCKDALKALDFGDSLLGVHAVPISNISVAIVKRHGTCPVPQRPVGAIPPVRIGAYGGSEQLSGEG
jgi:hypothetical protein